MKKLLFATIAAAFAVGATSADAQQLSASAGNPSWSNVNGTTGNSNGINSSSSDAGQTIHLTWGTSSPWSSKQSSYTYMARTPDWTVADPTFFNIGTFIHRNYPVTGNVLDNVTLNVSLTFEDLLTNSTYTVDRSIYIEHLETNNPTGDVVTLLNFGGPEVFTLGNYEYSFSFAGLFKYSNGTGLMNEFTTKESKCTFTFIACLKWDEKSTTGYLYANLDYRELPSSSVPEPSTYALMAAGLAGLAYVRRRRSA